MTSSFTSSGSEQLLPRILLIDDDAISREVLAMLLEMHGFPVDVAESGEEGLALLLNAPEVILMDSQMPGLSGVKLVAALRTHSAARIVAISGSEVGEELLGKTDGFLLKPIEPEALDALLGSGVGATEVEKTAVTTEPCLIDPATLGKLRAMMPASAVAEIYNAVATDLGKRLSSLESAMTAENGAEVRRIGHAIKGGCAMVGLTGAAEAASRLEMSNGGDTWPKELLHLRVALRMLQSIVGNGLPW